MRVILNADDFGYSDDTVAATIACFERRSLTSATIMPAMPATAAAIAYARARPDLSFGAHLTYAGAGEGFERPVLDPKRLPALVDETGRFLPGREIMKRAFLRRIPAAQIEAETEAQLGLLRDHGVALSHVDSHGHIHKFAAFVDALARVLPRFGITRVRRGQNVWIRKPWRSPTFIAGGLWHPTIARRFRTTERFFMPTCPYDVAHLDRLRWTGRGTLEIGVHPGSGEPWRRAEAEATDRLARDARAAGFEVCGWRDL